MSKTKEEMKKIDEHLSTKQCDIVSADQKLVAVRNELHELTERVSRTSMSLETLSEQLTTKLSMVRTIEAQIAAGELEKSELESHLIDLRSSVQNETQSLESLVSQIGVKQSELEQVKYQVLSSAHEMDAARIAFEKTMEQERARLKKMEETLNEREGLVAHREDLLDRKVERLRNVKKLLEEKLNKPLIDIII